MAIVKMSEFNLLALKESKESLLAGLQRFQNAHFKQVDESNEEYKELAKLQNGNEVSQYDLELSKIKYIIKKLEPFVPKQSMFGTPKARKSLTYDEFDVYSSKTDYKSIYDEFRESDETLRALKSEKNSLKADNDMLRQWSNLDVKFSDLDDMKSTVSILGYISSISYTPLLDTLDTDFKQVYFEKIGTYKDEVQVAMLVHKSDADALQQVLKKFGFIRFTPEFKEKPLSLIEQNNGRTEEIDKEVVELESVAKEKVDFYDDAIIVKDSLETLIERAKSVGNVLSTRKVIMLKGWFPTEDKKKFEDMLSKYCGEDYFLELKSVENDSEEVPIKLKNNFIVSAFESITSMYSLPKYNEFDPTPLLMPFYWLFFGLMVGDFGYGILMFLVLGFAYKFMNLKGGKNMIKFLWILSTGVIVGGLVYGSFFGNAVFKPLVVDGVAKPLLDTGNNNDIIMMLLLSMVIGYVQLMFGLIIKAAIAIKNKEYFVAVFDCGFWFLAVTSGIGFIVGLTGMIPEGPANIIKWVFLVSILVLVATQGRSAKTVGGKIAAGLFDVYNITGYVGDLVSYTRIAALALSGAYIAFSFNLMMTLLPEGPIRIIGGAFIFILGQSLNVGLACLGGYVHSCRLQYVEYFGKFYEGGGVKYAPLSYKNDSVDIKEN